MNDTPCILILTHYYIPGFKAGGPIRSIANMVDHLGLEFDFRIVTSDRDIGESKAYPGVEPNVWTQESNAKVLYVRPAMKGLLTIWRILNETDYSILYINGVFPRRFSIFPLLFHRVGLVPRVPVIIAPRGEFSPGALMIKPKRKLAFLSFIRFFRLNHNIVWHASSEFEVKDILRQFGTEAHIVTAEVMQSHLRLADGANVFIARDLPTRRTNEGSDIVPHKESGSLKIVFLSRISPIKNLDGAIRLLTGLKGNIEFHIYGPIEDREHWQECAALIKGLDENIKVNYCGILRHEEVVNAIAQYHLLFLPTHGENFGHVIAESLSAGCPVLISDQTPWRHLDRIGVGWDIPLDQPNEFRAVLAQCVEMGASGFRSLSLRTKVYGMNRISDQESEVHHRLMFEMTMQTNGANETKRLISTKAFPRNRY